MQRTIVYCDGSCQNNGKKNPVAGIGVYFGPNDERNVGRFIPSIKTNNQAELLAAITCLETFKHPSIIEIRTDSEYVVKGMNEWRHKWKRNGWMRTKTEPVMNKDLWIQLDKLDAFHDVKFSWVKGHVKNSRDGNYWADLLSRNS